MGKLSKDIAMQTSKGREAHTRLLISFINNCIIRLKMTEEQLSRTQNNGKFNSEITEAMWQGYRLHSKNVNKGHCIVALIDPDGFPRFPAKSYCYRNPNDAINEVSERIKAFPGKRFAIYQRLDNVPREVKSHTGKKPYRVNIPFSDKVPVVIDYPTILPGYEKPTQKQYAKLSEVIKGIRLKVPTHIVEAYNNVEHNQTTIDTVSDMIRKHMNI